MEKASGLISIIVPVYNTEKYLRQCLDSLVNQTYRDLEIILVDDGSTDSSCSICKEYAGRYPFINVIEQKNGGAAKARNTGLSVSHGQFIMFVDSDDYVTPEICQQLYDTLCRTNAECVACGFTAVDEDGNRLFGRQAQKESILSGKDVLRKVYAGEEVGFNPAGPCGRLFRVSMWGKNRFAEGLYYEDLEIMPRLYYGCEKIAVMPYIGYLYVIHEGSASHGTGRDDKRVTDSILIREKHIAFFDERGEYMISHAIIGKLLDLIVTSGKNGWVPDEQREGVWSLYKEYWKRYGREGKLSLRDRVRYELFFIRGIRSIRRYGG